MMMRYPTGVVSGMVGLSRKMMVMVRMIPAPPMTIPKNACAAAAMVSMVFMVFFLGLPPLLVLGCVFNFSACFVFVQVW